MGSRDWSALQVSKATKSFVQELRFARMTPVQAIAIPLLLNHRDVAVEACTGSGKTLAFLIPVVEILMRCSVAAAAVAAFSVGAAVLAPTRELAGQIHEVLGSFVDSVARHDPAAGAKLRKHLFVGGTEAKAASEAIRRASVAGDGSNGGNDQLQIVVATPGRLRAIMDSSNRGDLNLKTVEVLVLDEADRLLQLGFEMDINAILAAMPKQRRTGLFSATLTSELQKLMKTGMRNPVHVCVRLKRPAQPDAAKEAAAAAAAGAAAVAEKSSSSRAAAGPPADGQQQGGSAGPAAESAGDGASGGAAAAAGGRTRHELPTKLQNYAVTLPARQKLGFLRDFLELPEVRQGKTIVFFLTCACVDLFYTFLAGGAADAPGPAATEEDRQRERKRRRKGKKPSFSVAGGASGGRIEKLHGQMDEKARRKTYEKFCRSSPADGAVLLATDLAARGIDVQAVSWVVQFDAPQDPTAFVHRIGRAARAGQSGRSLVMLMPSEDSYLPFLGQRGIPMEALPSSLTPAAWSSAAGTDSGKEAGSAALAKAKKLVEGDRTVMLRATKAFVSYVRAYQEHQLPYLLPFKGLDLGSLATGFCLLRLPRMKEILSKKVRGFAQSPVDPSSVPFRNKAQEKLRQDKLKKQREEAAEADAEWTKEQAKAEKAKAKQAKPEKERTRTQKRQAKRNNAREEWELLAAEESLAKKLRNGKITGKQFEAKVQKATRRIIKAEQDDGEAGGSSDEDSSEDSDDAPPKKKRKGLAASVGAGDGAALSGQVEEDAKTMRWAARRKRRRSKGKRG